MTGWWIEVGDCGKEATEREGVWFRGGNVGYGEQLGATENCCREAPRTTQEDRERTERISRGVQMTTDLID